MKFKLIFLITFIMTLTQIQADHSPPSSKTAFPTALVPTYNFKTSITQTDGKMHIREGKKVEFSVQTGNMIFIVDIRPTLTDLRYLIKTAIPKMTTPYKEHLSTIKPDPYFPNLKKEAENYYDYLFQKTSRIFTDMKKSLQIKYDDLVRIMDLLQTEVDVEDLRNIMDLRTQKREGNWFWNILNTLLGAGGLGLGIWNTIATNNLKDHMKAQHDKIGEIVDRTTDITDATERNTKAIANIINTLYNYMTDDTRDGTHGVKHTMWTYQAAFTANKYDRETMKAMQSYTELCNHIDNIIEGVSVLLDHRVPINLMHPKDIEKQYTDLTEKAASYDRTPILTSPSQIYQLPTNFYTSHRTLVAIILVPLKPLSKYNPLSYTYNSLTPDHELMMINSTLWEFKPQHSLLTAISDEYNLHTTLPLSHLEHCNEHSEFYICEKLAIENPTTCVSELYFNHNLGECMKQITPLPMDQPRYMFKTSNEILFYTPHITDASYYCYKEKGTKLETYKFKIHKLTNITLGTRCDVRIGNISISTSDHISTQTEIHDSYHIQLEFTFPNFTLPESNYNITQALQNLTKIKKFNEITLHDLQNLKPIHPLAPYMNSHALLYGVIICFTLITITIIAIVTCYIYYSYKRYTRVRTEDPGPQIEMQTLNYPTPPPTLPHSPKSSSANIYYNPPRTTPPPTPKCILPTAPPQTTPPPKRIDPRSPKSPRTFHNPQFDRIDTITEPLQPPTITDENPIWIKLNQATQLTAPPPTPEVSRTEKFNPEPKNTLPNLGARPKKRTWIDKNISETPRDPENPFSLQEKIWKKPNSLDSVGSPPTIQQRFELIDTDLNQPNLPYLEALRKLTEHMKKHELQTETSPQTNAPLDTDDTTPPEIITEPIITQRITTSNISQRP